MSFGVSLKGKKKLTGKKNSWFKSPRIEQSIRTKFLRKKKYLNQKNYFPTPITNREKF